jgi:hypothetical protein
MRMRSHCEHEQSALVTEAIMALIAAGIPGETRKTNKKERLQ